MSRDPYRNRKILSEITKKSRFKTCYIDNNDCSGGIIKAHSISNSNVLSGISKNGELITPNINPDTLHDFVEMKMTGLNKCSVFTGMCSFHDKYFRPIDDHEYCPGNIEQEYLLVLRIAAREFYTKSVQNRGAKLLQ